ncbi:hypothetical protein HYDPIDRAFT_33619 [Hydnomerulius pinastri MD-312]|uniref:Uncharacterized protein n=1 Tax=Hydnomerulius pinastri MD-312 TaxID=994086 RepID=A0A0C9W7V4_9AGAM|nr:hypothetical protein HYDPIDRAFT_33619 [Hydnomerulius pinastri MD-312]
MGHPTDAERRSGPKQSREMPEPEGHPSSCPRWSFELQTGLITHPFNCEVCTMFRGHYATNQFRGSSGNRDAKDLTKLAEEGTYWKGMYNREYIDCNKALNDQDAAEDEIAELKGHLSALQHDLDLANDEIDQLQCTASSRSGGRSWGSNNLNYGWPDTSSVPPLPRKEKGKGKAVDTTRPPPTPLPTNPPRNKGKGKAEGQVAPILTAPQAQVAAAASSSAAPWVSTTVSGTRIVTRALPGIRITGADFSDDDTDDSFLPEPDTPYPPASKHRELEGSAICDNRNFPAGLGTLFIGENASSLTRKGVDKLFLAAQREGHTKALKRAQVFVKGARYSSNRGVHVCDVWTYAIQQWADPAWAVACNAEDAARLAAVQARNPPPPPSASRMGSARPQTEVASAPLPKPALKRLTMPTMKSSAEAWCEWLQRYERTHLGVKDSPFTLTLGAHVEDIVWGLAERGFTFAEADDTFVFAHQYINDVLSVDLPLSEPTRQVMIAHHGYAQSPGVVAASLEYVAQGSAQVAPSAEGPPYELMQGVPPSTGDAPPTMGVPPSTGPKQGPMDVEL